MIDSLAGAGQIHSVADISVDTALVASAIIVFYYIMYLILNAFDAFDNFYGRLLHDFPYHEISLKSLYFFWPITSFMVFIHVLHKFITSLFFIKLPGIYYWIKNKFEKEEEEGSSWVTNEVDRVVEEESQMRVRSMHNPITDTSTDVSLSRAENQWRREYTRIPVFGRSEPSEYRGVEERYIPVEDFIVNSEQDNDVQNSRARNYSGFADWSRNAGNSNS